MTTGPYDCVVYFYYFNLKTKLTLTLTPTDADELFFCPQATETLSSQRAYQHRLMGQFHSRGVEEMRFVRIPYSGM
jgi:hypothetical protein